MEARYLRAALCAAPLLFLGAGYRTQNFLVTTANPQFAQQVALAAEKYRSELAVEWLGEELPPWHEPCPITVHAAPHLGAGGATSFAFIGGRPTGWTMTIQGSHERVLDSVLPHEVTHTIFATHFGRPLPRWADEGACTVVEHESERKKQHRLLYEFLTTGRGIAFNHMFAMTEYPPDVLPLYSQGFSLVRFLIAQGGKQKYVKYVGDGMRWNNWTRATQVHYGFESLSELQITWLDWVRQGSREEWIPNGLPRQEGPVLASASEPQPNGSDPLAAQNSLAVRQASSTSAVPVRQASASTGWYARVRDEAASQGVPKQPTSGGAAEAKPLTPFHESVSQALSRGPTRNETPPQMVTRPQPVEQAQQQVLEWIKP